ncbi:MAG: AbgT family transporter [Pyrinomonadaceae bacterium]|nr:AbgT family transporter [Pyrinomonadaceae bacterium]MCX7639148.1 AbgT family transporter [Pyrinomonadaceae bacterium]MDW8303631.1 AbgT family transporter [Acidobacteriota bacterium]
MKDNKGFIEKSLNVIEKLGNKLPDPAALFVILLFVVWILSALLSSVSFSEIDPRTGKPIVINNQITGTAIANFLSNMVTTFTSFHPLGVVLVALLGVGVAEHTGFINAMLKALLNITSTKLLTPMLIFVAIISHTAADAGYVLVIPLGGVIFYTAGRHPLAGISAAFAGVSGGFSANFIPSSLDPLLAGLTQSAAQILDPSRTVNPLCNWFFTTASCLVIVGVGWYLTDKVIEPRLKNVEIDGDPEDMPKMENIASTEKKGLIAGLLTLALGIVVLIAASFPQTSPLRSPVGYRITDASLEKLKSESLPEEILKKVETIKNQDFSSKTAFENALKSKIGEENLKKHEKVFLESAEKIPPQLTSSEAPLMKAIVPLIFILFILPGIVYGYAAKTIKNHRDIIQGMSKSMSSMGYYIVLAFFASLFIASFSQSNIGALLAIKGANFLKDLGLPGQVTIVGVIVFSALVNLLIGSASAKWALLAPIFVPMLMQLGISPELSQAAYRIGDSVTNIITPLMPYFPLVVVFARRYVKDTGIGTLISLMLPYSVGFLITWVALLLIYWALGLPLGLQAPYTYP